MTLRISKPFIKQYKNLPATIRKKVDRQLHILPKDFRHPSLHAKKIQGTDDFWEARVDYKNRFTFQMVNDIIILRKVGSHDVINNP